MAWAVDFSGFPKDKLSLFFEKFEKSVYKQRKGEENMHDPKNEKRKWIWLVVLFLFIGIAVTVVLLMSNLGNFLMDDSGAISLVEDDKKIDPGDLEGEEDGEDQKIASFQISDGSQVWDTYTQIDLFRVSYENGQQEITVLSDNGDELIAPGTENSYTFKLKNNGEVALDYTVSVDAYIVPADTQIPMSGRMNRYDGKWVVGSETDYANVQTLDGAQDSATLGAGKYTYYTFDWLWPFESGNDELDTMLGNMAVDQELTFTLAITTIAEVSGDPYDDSGITPPRTGDDSNPVLWFVLAISSLALILILLFYRRKDEEQTE